MSQASSMTCTTKWEKSFQSTTIPFKGDAQSASRISPAWPKRKKCSKKNLCKASPTELTSSGSGTASIDSILFVFTEIGLCLEFPRKTSSAWSSIMTFQRTKSVQFAEGSSKTRKWTTLCRRRTSIPKSRMVVTMTSRSSNWHNESNPLLLWIGTKPIMQPSSKMAINHRKWSVGACVLGLRQCKILS